MSSKLFYHAQRHRNGPERGGANFRDGPESGGGQAFEVDRKGVRVYVS